MSMLIKFDLNFSALTFHLMNLLVLLHLAKNHKQRSCFVTFKLTFG